MTDAGRWEKIGDLFDAASSLDPSDRAAYLRAACGGDDRLRAEVEGLLDHDERADRDGFLGDPGPSSLEGRDTMAWSAPLPSATPPGATAARPDESDGSDGFSPKPVLAPGRRARAAEEARAVVQSRLRELPVIHILVFGMMLILRPAVLGSLSVPIVAPFAALAAALAGMSLLLATRRFSLRSLRWLDLAMSLALAAVLVAYESQAIAGPLLQVDRIKAEKIMKNVILLLSFLMLIDAIYVPKGWRPAALLSGLLALVPLGTLAGTALAWPESVLWVGQLRSDGVMPLAVFAVDTAFLVTLGAISTFAAHTISRLRSEVIEARRLGQYRLGERIGAGGMGEVYLAEHELLKRPCAVKLIRPEAITRAGTVERFEREVRINATLSHPNTVEIFDYGRTEDGTYYYVMEYLPGMSLAELVERHGPLPPGRAVYLLRQVAQALVEAHEAGLIHRDIKPSNVVAARRGGMDDVAKVLDFGLVRPPATTLAPAGSRSDEGQILGTPLYMAPEQATGGRKLDARGDIYALGAVGYFLLTGRPPFDAGSAIEAIIAHARDPVVPPSTRRAGLPGDLDAVILRCLAKDPADRFADAGALDAALARCGCAAEWDRARARRWWRERAGSDQNSRSMTIPGCGQG